LKCKEPANLTALPDSARGENQLIRLISNDLPTLSVGKPKEKDNGQHETPICERKALRDYFVHPDDEERAGARQ
jgi:hypothetical protein